MIVLAIMATLIGLGISQIKKKDNNIKSITRKMLVLTKEVRNKARLTSSTYRIVFQLDDKEPTYWVESASGRVRRETPEELETREKSQSSEKEKSPPRFTKDTRFGKKPTKLPSGFFFKEIEVEGVGKPTTSGTEFIYYSPDGFVEPSIIQITDKKNITWTLAIHPLTGHADLLQEAKNLKDIKR